MRKGTVRTLNLTKKRRQLRIVRHKVPCRFCSRHRGPFEYQSISHALQIRQVGHHRIDVMVRVVIV